jgi:hypothetical protein
MGETMQVSDDLRHEADALLSKAARAENMAERSRLIEQAVRLTLAADEQEQRSFSPKEQRSSSGRP